MTPPPWSAATCRLCGGHRLENYYRAVFVGGRASAGAGRPSAVQFVGLRHRHRGRKNLHLRFCQAYAVVYFRLSVPEDRVLIIFVTLMLPVEVRIYPTYKVGVGPAYARHLCGLILPLIASATGTLLFRQFFHDRAGRVAGGIAHRRRRTFPVFSGIRCCRCRSPHRRAVRDPVIYGWNQYLWPLLITTEDSMRPSSRHQENADHDDELAEWQLAMATAVLAMLPPVAVVVFMQRLFVRGMVETEKVRRIANG